MCVCVCVLLVINIYFASIFNCSFTIVRAVDMAPILLLLQFYILLHFNLVESELNFFRFRFRTHSVTARSPWALACKALPKLSLALRVWLSYTLMPALLVCHRVSTRHCCLSLPRSLFAIWPPPRSLPVNHLVCISSRTAVSLQFK